MASPIAAGATGPTRRPRRPSSTSASARYRTRLGNRRAGAVRRRRPRPPPGRGWRRRRRRPGRPRRAADRAPAAGSARRARWSPRRPAGRRRAAPARGPARCAAAGHRRAPRPAGRPGRPGRPAPGTRRSAPGLRRRTPQATIATWMFSAAVRIGARPLSCGTSTTCSATAWSRSRSGVAVDQHRALAGRTRPAIAHSSVVLPAPDGPVTASSRPGSATPTRPAAPVPVVRHRDRLHRQRPTHRDDPAHPEPPPIPRILPHNAPPI